MGITSLRQFLGLRSGLSVKQRLRFLLFLLRVDPSARRGGIAKFEGRRIEFTDGLSVSIEYKDIFLHEVYAFPSLGSAPVIFDGGACIGMAALWFRQRHPAALVTCFEPDPMVAGVLRRNLSANGCSDVAVEQIALGETDGTVSFAHEGADAGRVSAAGAQAVPMRRLSPFVPAVVDFLKLNIEGQELGVIRELAASGALARIRNVTIEYHGWKDARPCLGPLLILLEEAGFRYVVHDFDHLTCGTSKPPYGAGLNASWFCLVVAGR